MERKGRSDSWRGGE